MHKSDIAAMAVHGIPPFSRHLKKDAPLLLAGIRAGLLGDVVAVVDDDRYLRERHELRLRSPRGCSFVAKVDGEEIEEALDWSSGRSERA